MLFMKYILNIIFCVIVIFLCNQLFADNKAVSAGWEHGAESVMWGNTVFSDTDSTINAYTEVKCYEKLNFLLSSFNFLPLNTKNESTSSRFFVLRELQRKKGFSASFEFPENKKPVSEGNSHISKSSNQSGSFRLLFLLNSILIQQLNKKCYIAEGAYNTWLLSVLLCVSILLYLFHFEGNRYKELLYLYRKIPDSIYVNNKYLSCFLSKKQFPSSQYFHHQFPVITQNSFFTIFTVGLYSIKSKLNYFLLYRVEKSV